MSGIGGPGGIGGPKGPGGASGPSEVSDTSDVSDASEVSDVSGTSGTGSAADIDALAADIAAGRLTPREAVDKLVDQIATTEHLGVAERAELKDMLTDLVANDPYLASLVGRI